MDPLNIALTVVGGLVLIVGLLSSPLDRSWLSTPLFAFLIGVALGPHGLAALDPMVWGDGKRLLEETARLTLGISLMGIALRLPPSYPFVHWRALLVLLGIAMPAMYLISSLLTYWVMGLPLLMALLVGGTVCATDPVVASSIVTGGVAKENLPDDYRHLLSAESGANDGLAFPLVLLPILLLSLPAGDAWLDWFGRVWLWEIAGGTLIGIALGWMAGRALQWSETRGFLDQPSFLSITLALTLLVLGLGELLGTNSILGVFAAGLAFDQEVGGKERGEEDNVQEAVNILLTMPVFVLFGLIAPWSEWQALGLQGGLLALLVLLLRRLPVILLLRPWLPELRDWPVTLIMGWFGPIGVSALYYATLVSSRTGYDLAWTVGTLIVLASMIAHGTTATPLAQRYGRWLRRHRSEAR
ncbi:sodium:proton antiporter [Halomonas sp. MCCC 1A17488]|uniref:cation:proton antiporter domain-containing protein n=1 Tax=unclassified Halomonas TaxID=2609666 RepID=UPI0018D24BCD|nr:MULTISPECIES: cation:proton antiporter [unclassified Halomonas]MCE8017895.1 sodium:proton antiporter [Halomonas sp. MCCC 1A17488]MCG3241228.1 sodium:proton antiporter [Halomonas sp. MCCC 1A17488]QPP49075.1 cation:proton antiporter [Halomonas sp. SS10-MC5]